jgi:demethylmenaquinone methyltransferase/2-methoxy-6-polyprenyl-1,4-benzoquinol methylase
MPDEERGPIDEQMRYYRARAGEYDAWFHREGRYDRGEEHRTEWRSEIALAEAALDETLAEVGPDARALELACGTGLWTPRIARAVASVTALDASPEVMDVARERLAADTPDRVDRVTWREVDLFGWRPDDRWDLVFFGFWLSHVPNDRFDAFWATVADALAPGGRVFFLDSLWNPESTAKDHRLGDPEAGIVTRRLDDGRVYQVVKVFRRPDRLEERLAGLGWTAEVRTTGRFFHWGRARR